jgi:hypothetical protein
VLSERRSLYTKFPSPSEEEIIKEKSGNEKKG